MKPCPVRVSADCPFSPMSVVLLPCSHVSWHWPLFKQILLQIRGAITTLKRSRVDARSAHQTSLWTLSQMTSRWEIIREGILASFNAVRKEKGAFTVTNRSNLNQSTGTGLDYSFFRPKSERSCPTFRGLFPNLMVRLMCLIQRKCAEKTPV